MREVKEDDYGNPLNEDGLCDRLIYCCFPDCGCDGARLCMAEKGASERALWQNIERMYSRTDQRALLARASLQADVFIKMTGEMNAASEKGGK
jgi:hypothetical protein